MTAHYTPRFDIARLRTLHADLADLLAYLDDEGVPDDAPIRHHTAMTRNMLSSLAYPDPDLWTRVYTDVSPAQDPDLWEERCLDLTDDWIKANILDHTDEEVATNIGWGVDEGRSYATKVYGYGILTIATVPFDNGYTLTVETDIETPQGD